MSTTRQNAPAKSTISIVLHAIQIILAIPVMGVAGYGLTDGYSDEFTNVIGVLSALLTIVACIYIIGSSTFFPILHHPSVVVGMHFFFIVLWLFQFTATGAKRVLQEIGISHPPEFIVKVVGSLLGSTEFLLWITTFAVLVTRWVKTRRASTHTAYQPAQTYNDSNELEQKIPTASLSQPTYQPYGQSTTSTSTLPTQYHQSTQGPFTTQQTGYSQSSYQQTNLSPQDPIVRADTVSPLSTGPQSSAPYVNSPLQHHATVSNVPKTSGTYSYDPDLPELSTRQMSLGFHKNGSEVSVPRNR